MDAGVFSLLAVIGRWSAVPAMVGTAVACGCAAWVVFAVLRHLCLRPILAADPADLAASPLAVTWPLVLPDRIFVGPDEVGVTRRVHTRRWNTRLGWVVRADWPEIGDVTAVTVTEPGTRAFPSVRRGQTIAIGRPALRISVRDTTWCLPARTAERLARLIDLRAARHRATRPRPTQEYDRAVQRP